MSSNSNRLIVLDFDGTSDDNADFPGVHPEVQEVLARAASRAWRWVINSDRTRDDLLRIVGELPGDLHPAAVVAQQRIIEFADGEGGYRPHTAWNEKCAAAHRALGLRLAPYIGAWAKEVRATFRVRLDLSTRDWLAFVVHPEDVPALRAQLDTWLKGFYEAEVSSNHESCFVVHREFCKGKATREVARLLGAKRTHVGAIGDALNDLPMLQPDTSGTAGCPASACMAVRRHVLSRTGGFVAQSDGALGTVEILNAWLSALPITDQSPVRAAGKGDHDA